MYFSKKRAWVYFFAVVIVIMAIQGCVYWRLLSFKSQLKEFEHYFTVEITDAFSLHFKEPMLYSKDILYLSKIQPSEKQKKKHNEIWSFIFERDTKKNERDSYQNLTFKMSFNHDLKLTSITLGPVFLSMVPASFLEYSLRSLVHASVDKKKRKVDSKVEWKEELEWDIPKREDIEKALGTPNQVDQIEGYPLVHYDYKLKGAPAHLLEEKKGSANVKLTFDKKTDELIYLFCNFAGMKLSIHYNDKGKRIASKM